MKFTTKHLLTLTLLVAVAFPLYARLRPRVAIVIRNSTPTVLGGIKVFVSSGAFSVGDVASGKLGDCAVLAKGMSSIEISYRCSDGTTMRQLSNVFFDTDSKGPIIFEIGSDGLIEKLDCVQAVGE